MFHRYILRHFNGLCIRWPILKDLCKTAELYRVLYALAKGKADSWECSSRGIWHWSLQGKNKVWCLSQPPFRVTQQSEATWMQHRGSASASELLQPQWGRTMCRCYAQLHCCPSFQGSGKKCPGVKQEVFHSRNMKPNCNSDLTGYPKPLAHKWGWKHYPNRLQNSLAA